MSKFFKYVNTFYFSVSSIFVNNILQEIAFKEIKATQKNLHT